MQGLHGMPIGGQMAQSLSRAVDAVQLVDMERIAVEIQGAISTLRDLNNDNAALADRLFGAMGEAAGTSPAAPTPDAKMDLVYHWLRDLTSEIDRAQAISKRLHRLA